LNYAPDSPADNPAATVPIAKTAGKHREKTLRPLDFPLARARNPPTPRVTAR